VEEDEAMTDEPDNKAGNDLTPEQKAEATRELKKLLQGVEDDEEIFYYLAPFREETEGDVESSPQPGGEDGEEEKAK
jgi:hypothetical protein